MLKEKKILDLCDKCEHQVVCQKVIEIDGLQIAYVLRLLGIKHVTILIDVCGNFKEKPL